MHNLPLPSLHIEEVYPNCANRTESEALRSALLAEQARVLARSVTYGRMGLSAAFHQIPQEAAVHVSRADLGGLYDRVLVNGGERHVYLAIRGACPYGRCPFCVQRDVRTLDHFLPKNLFPEFAVLPANLVPCCFDCNHAKSSHISNSSESQVFHPYFDDWSHLDLLRAAIEWDDAVDVEFSINVGEIPPLVAARATLHFEKLQLGSLYSDHASVELVQRKASFEMTFDDGGPEALRLELWREFQSRRVPFPNAWQPALYRALANSDDFVNGGFAAIDQVH